MKNRDFNNLRESYKLRLSELNSMIRQIKKNSVFITDEILQDRKDLLKLLKSCK